MADSKLWQEAYKSFEREKVYFSKFSNTQPALKRLTKKQLRKLQRKPRVPKIVAPPARRKLYLYVLRLEDNCWYIGITSNVLRRYARHNLGKGARWTALHKPRHIHKTIELGVMTTSEAAKLEDELTLKYAALYGRQYVRGGGFCQVKPQWNEKPGGG